MSDERIRRQPLDPTLDPDRFDDALRRWAQRPPRTPAEEAARRIEARLPERRHRTTGRWSTPELRERGWGHRWGAPLAAATALVAAVGLAVVFAPPRPVPGRLSDRPPTVAAEAPLAVEAPPAPTGDVLVIDLDERTTLYMNLTPTPRQGDRT